MTSRRTTLLLLDLHACSDGFVGDGALSITTSKLRNAGHEVAWVQSVRDTFVESNPQSSWLEHIAAEVRKHDADFVVLPRAWDRQLAQAVRDAMQPEAKLVRLTSGVAAALDEMFDQVVNEGDLITLAAGGSPEVRPLWQPTRARELRRLPRLDESSNLVKPISIDSDAIVNRPIITGPATGCPFLLDVRTNPIFDRANIDATRIQTRGCSFCLDNHGSYAVPSEEDVLTSWLGQWRKIRESRPDVREVLLVDERPHPFLPAFFEAIEREPELGGIELMIKSRVDWLLEFAGDHLARALQSAERSSSVLHLYLVGFESFDSFHLELFNKGVSVKDNVKAIELLRDLERRFPRSFEFRKYRAHGIVLFTPWTTPELLLENARRMREVRFHELRAEAIRTRLRLYPRTPLHALAKADGLLADHFGDRGDRAVEQGYDASVPWRFRDSRVELIERTVTEWGRIDRATREDRLLELATHVVMRWPNMTVPPNEAWMHSCKNLGLWDEFTSDDENSIGPIVAAFDPEIEGVFLGIKRASLKEGIAIEHAEALAETYRGMGLQAGIVNSYDFDSATGMHSTGTKFATVAVAATKADLERVLELQRAHTTGTPALVESMGDLMGYPACCIAAFDAQDDRGDNLENERLTYLRAPNEAQDPLIHRLARIKLVSHHLCRPSCEPSRVYAQKLMDRMEELEPVSAARVRHHLSRTILTIDYHRQIEIEGEWDGDKYRVNRAAVFKKWQKSGNQFDFDVTAIVAVSVWTDRVEIEFRDGSTRELRALRPLLVTPNQPLARRALEAIAPVVRERPSAKTALQVAGPILPKLPSVIRVGAAVHSYRIASVQTQEHHHEVVIANATDRIRLELRAIVPGRTETLRADPWAVRIDQPESLSDDAKAAISVFVRALVIATRADRR